MVRLESEDQRGVKGILIDGYMPNFSYIKEIDWEKVKKEKLSTNPKRTYTWTATGLDFERTYESYLKSEREIPNVLMQTAIYSHLIGSLRDRFCPKPDRKGETCRHRFYPGRGYKSLKHGAKFYKEKMHGFKEWKPIPILYHEIELDEAQGIDNYGLSLLWLNQKPYKKCSVFEECQNNWMDFLHFQIKEKTAYNDFEQFRPAAQAFLNNMIEKAIEYHYFFK